MMADPDADLLATGEAITNHGDHLKLVAGYGKKDGFTVQGFLAIQAGKVYIVKDEPTWVDWNRMVTENEASARKLEKKYAEEGGKRKDPSTIRVAANLLHPWRELQQRILWCSPVPVERVKSSYISERERWLKLGYLPNHPIQVMLWPGGHGEVPVLEIRFKQEVRR
jgi:hypothetical protein